MAKAWIIFIVIFLIAGGVIAYLYFFYEKPRQDKEVELINLNIFSIEEPSKLQVRTGYKIIVDGVLYDEGKTLKGGPIVNEVPKNKSVIVYNYNLEDQDYYTFEKQVNTAVEDNYRVNLDLKSVGELNITHEGVLGKNLTIKLKVKSLEFFKGMMFCFDESPHIVYINVDFPRIDNIDGNKCFLGQTLEKNEELTILINYEKFGDIDINDYIKVFFYDTDEIPLNIEKNYIEREVYEIKG